MDMHTMRLHPGYRRLQGFGVLGGQGSGNRAQVRDSIKKALPQEHPNMPLVNAHKICLSMHKHKGLSSLDMPPAPQDLGPTLLYQQWRCTLIYL